jgi:hypothetical protein
MLINWQVPTALRAGDECEFLPVSLLACGHVNIQNN